MPTAMPAVLVVEDDEAVRGFLVKALERGGWEPLSARMGEEALRCARENRRIVAVLIDGLLPDMHGTRLADQLLDDERTSHAAICFVSGAIREHHPAQHGVAALSKPLRVRELLAYVEELVTWHDSVGDPVSVRRDVLRTLEDGFLVGP